ncbi:hypothetical protein LUZ60_016347 [Juncus effusus]|nr:hypothetical protein LUZ60_016347 [Juncus effusus]
MVEDKDEELHMSSLPPPSKHPRLSSENDAGQVTMAASSPLGLGLGLCLGNGAQGNRAQRPSFTFMQLQELEHQALIYKYMAAGVPVPLHLVLPIWKSIAASSFGPHHYPSLMGLGSLCFDYRNSMEPEPGRCRRTDGKKWRCSREVVAGQKYCERHVHRGRGRSRKPVEATGHVAASSPYVNNSPRSLAAPPKEYGAINGARQLSVSAQAGGGVQFLAGGSNSSSANSVSPPRLAFSPTSVL